MTRQELMLPSSAAENLLLSRLAFITTSHINPKKGKTLLIYCYFPSYWNSNNSLQFHDFFQNLTLIFYFNVCIFQDTSPLWGYKFTENRNAKQLLNMEP